MKRPSNISKLIWPFAILVLMSLAISSPVFASSTISVLEQFASSATASSEYSADDWSAMQATGAPNLFVCEDLETAWAPRTSGPDPEWLEVFFDVPVKATELSVRETYEAGFITQVDLIDTKGAYHTIWTGTDTTRCQDWFTLSFPETSYLVVGIKIYTQMAGWEEIDAVQLIGDHVSQYASSAIASSEYSADDWSAMQATGAPNAFVCEDLETSWAPRTSGPDPEWLEVFFDVPVKATELSVRETYEAGFITQVDLIDTEEVYHTIWTGADTTGCPGWFTLSFPETSYLVVGIKIYTQTDGWEEIDAVQLIGVIAMDCFGVNFMKVMDKKRWGAKHDKIQIGGSLKLVEIAAPFDAQTDVVTVTINGEAIVIPAGSFEKKDFFWLHYYCFKGNIADVGRVHMHLNFNKCRWWIRIYGKEARDLVDSEGATVKLNIGMNVGEDSFDWTRKRERRWIGFAKFIELPPIRCCGMYGIGH